MGLNATIDCCHDFGGLDISWIGVCIANKQNGNRFILVFYCCDDVVIQMALSDYYKFPLDEAESKEFQQPPVNKWNALLLSKGFRFTLLLVGCAFIGVVMPVIWTNLWRESDDYTIESDLRYDCSPLRPNSTVLKSSCEDVCIWDEYAKFNEIVCYYRLEVDSDVSDHHSIMPSYLVEHETDAYNYDLKIMKSAPFLNASNAEIKEAPIVETHLSVSISHYSENHFRVLIKPKNEGKMCLF